MECPCGSGNKYSDCCGKAHQHLSNAITAEQLMRSRYAAFTKGMGDYLLESHHSMTRPKTSEEIVRWANSVKWLKLEIIRVEAGGTDAIEGIVEFKAHFKERGRKNYIHEISQFKREYGNWVYFKAL